MTNVCPFQHKRILLLKNVNLKISSNRITRFFAPFPVSARQKPSLRIEIMRMLNQILKKTAPQYNSNSLNGKKTQQKRS